MNVVAHRLPTARSADCIVVIDDGRVAEQGTHDELVARGGAYAALWAAFATTGTAGANAAAGPGDRGADDVEDADPVAS